MLVESCPLDPVNSLVIGPWSFRNPIASIFLVIHSRTQVRTFPRLPRSSDRSSNMTQQQVGQVIAPLLVIRRVTMKNALTMILSSPDVNKESREADRW